MHDLAYNQRTKEVVSDNLDVTEAPFNHDDSNHEPPPIE